jgi:GNAT superfamily N-acetyltransferase
LCWFAWYRFFTEEEHGEGFVDPATPEVAIAVVDGMRGRGIGGALMLAIHERSREQGIARISLTSIARTRPSASTQGSDTWTSRPTTRTGGWSSTWPETS